jgi:hypothetical protein
MPAKFKKVARSMLKTFARKGVLREADRLNLLQMLEERPNQLIDVTQRSIRQAVYCLGQTERFNLMLSACTEAAVIAYLRRLLPNYRLFFLNLIQQALSEIIHGLSTSPSRR